MENLNLESKGIFCLTSNFVMFLRYYAIDITESELWMLLGAYGFCMEKNSKHMGDFVNGRNGNFEELFERFRMLFLEKLPEQKIAYENECLSQPFFENCINYAHPVFLKIDDFYLKLSNYFRRESYITYVLLLGIENNKVTYYDNGIRELEISEFMKAINFNNSVYTYSSDKSEITLKYQTNKNIAIENGFNQFYTKMLHAPDENGNIFYGLSGMEQLCKELDFKHDKQYWYNVYFCLSNPSGLVKTRLFISEFVQKINYVGREDEVMKCTESYRFLSEEWRVVGNLFFKLSRVYGEELIVRIRKRILQLITKEKESLESLCFIIGEINT